MLSLPHLPVTEHYLSCAFTQKIIKMSKMLLSLGHETYIYGAKTTVGSQPPCTKFIETHTVDDIAKSWGKGDNRFEIGYDWQKEKGYIFDTVEPLSAAHLKYYDNATKLVKENSNEDDFLLCSQGMDHKVIADAVNLFLTCEPGIGYKSSFARFRAFESAYIQNFTYGMNSGGEYKDVKHYDRVIGNYFEPDHFPFVDRAGKEDYFLYIGRVIAYKGVHIAMRLALDTETKLYIAGQSDADFESSKFVEYVGFADVEKRADLMSHAKAVIVPTLYLEPFGGVNVEAQLCGTPVITSNAGVFPETVIDGVTGFRCDTYQDFLEATQKVDSLDPKAIRKHAEKYLMENIRWEFQKWFDDLYHFYEAVKEGDTEAWYRIWPKEGIQLNNERTITPGSGMERPKVKEHRT